ncbi:hypothetical protein PVAND_017685 [Polypedilum vanderplanki]|uniref:Ionotropic receptor n=1 Tax=Polypedilum vanderplanki TaxID=319348 RepID=A0A9J6B9A6_POLVA|nr:hypothetical protein PVAND_017685 [Polypedilum vanderplanki]
MKFFILLILMLTAFAFASKYSLSFDSEKTAISTALSDVINVFLVQQKIQFNILIVGTKTKSQSDVINDAIKNIEYGTKINHTSKIIPQNVEESLVIFGDEKLMKNINKQIKFTNFFPKQHKIIIYTKNLKLFNVDEFLSTKTGIYLYEAYFERNITQNADPFLYFLHDTANKIDLVTFEWFTETKCNRISINIINTCSKLELKWKTELKTYKKFHNFYRCKIVAIQLQFSYKDKFNKISGEIFDTLEAIGTKANFSVYRQLKTELVKGKEIYINNVKHLLKLVPQIASDFRPAVHKTQFTTTAFANNKCVAMISKGQLYSSYEKLFLPFDFQTWYWLVFTFFVAFCIIFIVNQMSREIQILIYGASIHFPAFNVIGTFFGISQF